MLRMSRRYFLGLSLLGGVSVLVGRQSAHASVPESMQAFAATRVEDAIKQLYGVPVQPSEQISLELPVFAESSTTVPVSVKTTLPKVEQIALLVARNKFPLVVVVQVAASLEPYLATHIVVERSSDVIALVRTVDGLYMTMADVVIQSNDGCV